MDTRQLFENWYSAGGRYSDSIERDEHGEYKFSSAMKAWIVWEVAAKEEREECAKIANRCIQYDDGEVQVDDGWYSSISAAIQERSNA